MKIYEKAATTRCFVKSIISRYIFILSVSDIRYPTFFRFRFVQSRGPLFYCHITSAPVIYVPIWENHVRNKFCLNLILLFIERTNYNNFLWIFSRLHIRRMYSEYMMTIKTQFILYHNNYFSPIKVSKFIIPRFDISNVFIASFANDKDFDTQIWNFLYTPIQWLVSWQKMISFSYLRVFSWWDFLDDCYAWIWNEDRKLIKVSMICRISIFPKFCIITSQTLICTNSVPKPI